MLSLILFGWAAAAGRAEAPAQATPLARYAPVETRLYLEVRDIHSLLEAPGGSPAAGLLAALVRTTTTAPAETQPARPADWRRVVADAVGLHDEDAIRLLFDGPLALAADGWSRLGDAALLALPRDPAALEAVLAGQRVEESASASIRRYALKGDHELACDGRVVVLGRTGSATGQYARTVALWSSEQPVALAELAVFQDRMAAIFPDSACVFYAGGGQRGGAVTPQTWWPENWPHLSAIAAGVGVSPRGVMVEGSGVIVADADARQQVDLPLDVLSRLPASALIAWNHTIPYAQAFRRLNDGVFDGPIRFGIDLLQVGLPPGSVEQRLLGNLVGDTILVVAGAPLQPDGEREGEPLILPAFALAVETSDPQAVEEVLHLVANNLVRLLNLPDEEADAYRMEGRPLGPEGGTVYSIGLGRLFGGLTSCPFLVNIELSWTLADRWLILATRADTVREIVAARRGLAPCRPVAGVHRALRDVQVEGGAARILLTASPAELGGMIDSWLRYLAAHHPDVLQPDWWRLLRQRQRAEGVQLGILPSRLTDNGIEVDQTLPGWPAHERLVSGDVILGIDGRPLDRDNLMQSLRRGMATRERADRISLRISRGGEEQDVEIPMPEPETPTDRLQPIELLRQLADILRPFASAGYAAWQPSPEVIHARLELQFTTTAPSE